VRACLGSGRRAVVIVPEASPVPATVSALRAVSMQRVVVVRGWRCRERYRTWLRMAGDAGRRRGDPPAVFARCPDRVALGRARVAPGAARSAPLPPRARRGAAARRSSVRHGARRRVPSTETAALGCRRWRRHDAAERRGRPPGAEGARRARPCARRRDGRSCSRRCPATGWRRCAARAARRPRARPAGHAPRVGRRIRSSSAGAGGCATCGGSSFGCVAVVERVEEWAARAARCPFGRPTARGSRRRTASARRRPRRGARSRVADLDLVAILDVDLAAAGVG
jgi:hypothetical protein